MYKHQLSSSFLMCDAPFSLGLQSGVIFASQPYGLPLNETIMPQYFQKLGYRRHMVGKVSTVVDIVSWFRGHKSETISLLVSVSLFLYIFFYRK